MAKSSKLGLALGLALGWALAWPLAAQTELESLDLHRAIQLALEEGPRLAAADAAIRAAEAGVAEAQAAGRVNLALEADLARTTQPVHVFGGLLVQEKFGPENFALDFLNEPDPLTHASTRLVARMPLFTGGRLTAGRQVAEAQVDGWREARELTRQHLSHQVVEAYSGALLADRHLEALAAALKAANQNLALVEDHFQSGLVVEADVLQAKLRCQELLAQQAQAEAQAEIARDALALLLGQESGRRWRLEPWLEATPGTGATAPLLPPPDLDAALDLASRQRHELRALEAEIRALEALARLERGATLPEVGLGATLEAAGDYPLAADGTNWSVGLSAKWTLFDGGRAKARQAKVKADSEGSLARLADQRAQIQREVRAAFFQLGAAEKRREAGRRDIELAERSLEIVRDRYQEGLAPWVELLGAEASLTNARARALAADRDQLLARAALSLATGSL